MDDENGTSPADEGISESHQLSQRLHGRASTEKSEGPQKYVEKSTFEIVRLNRCNRLKRNDLQPIDKKVQRKREMVTRYRT